MPSILLIDNDQAVREALGARLTAAGYSVRGASNGRLGVNAFRKAPTDLVITDLYMPDRDGLEVIEALRRTHPLVKIIAMSGASGSMGYLQLAQSLGAMATLRKPFTTAALLAIAAELLNQDGPGSEVAAPEVP